MASEISKPPVRIFVMGGHPTDDQGGHHSGPRRPWRHRRGRAATGTIEAMADQQQSDAAPPVIGPNAWLVEEMYEQFQADPSSVSENWRDFFEDYRSSRPRPAPPGPCPRRLPPLAPSTASERSGPGRGPPRPLCRLPRPPPAPAAERPTGCRGADPRRRADRRQHGAQPRCPDGDELPRHPGQAARGQPQGDQRLPGRTAGARSASPTSSPTPSFARSPTTCRQ